MRMRLVAVLLLWPQIAGCVDFRTPLEKWAGSFPPSIELTEVVSETVEEGLLEGCASVVFKLSDQSARALRQSPPSAEKEMTSGRDGEELEPWAKGPLPEAPHPYNPGDTIWVTTMGEMRQVWDMDCSSGGDYRENAALDALSRELASGAAYFTSYNRGEGLLVVAPNIGLAGHFYHG